ncbi:MAG: SDR family NAD(P)-dependent oxidoreductase [Fimbriimonas sp.]|nr:SDR family NAD(P)-dependent oxidoreductase [Fimbriimonas sp.]
MNKADISGKWALVTGASRGIGRQVSLGLAEYGCNLVLHSRDEAHTAALAAELRAKRVEVRQVSAELSEPAQVEAMLDGLLSKGPSIDILYNNAAVQIGYREDWLNVPSEDIRVSFEVNCTALIRICNRLIPGMIERGWGRIINVTSGVRDQPQLTAYAVSKAAVDKYVLDTAAHLKTKGVLMNLLDPGWLRTDLGGPNAPGAVESVVPGALVPALIDDGTVGQLFHAQDWAGKQL